jgi:hypothetical protein
MQMLKNQQRRMLEFDKGRIKIMIKFRPHRGSVNDAMKEAVEFNRMEELKSHIVSLFENAFSEDDIVIDESEVDDERIDWHHTHYVCVKRFGPKKYDCPQCIGMVDIVMVNSALMGRGI